MRMKWGALYRKLPFFNGEKGGYALISIKTSSSTHLSAVLFQPREAVAPERVRTDSCSLFVHG
jgi:hypothetical protein